MVSEQVKSRQGLMDFRNIDEMEEPEDMFEQDNQFFPEIMDLNIDAPIVARVKTTKELGYELGVTGIRNRVHKVRTEEEILNVIRSIDIMQTGINKYVLKLERQKDYPAIENMMNLKIRLCSLTEVALSKLKVIELERSYFKVIKRLAKDFGITEEYWVELIKESSPLSIIKRLANDFGIGDKYWRSIKNENISKEL